MYQAEFFLKQHTPLIHFQPDQAGATLRASEVKPKLDKYLINMVFAEEFEKIKKFLVGYSAANENALKKRFTTGFSALDYKLSVNVNHSVIEIIPIEEKFPCYFGNMGDENKKNPKQFSYTSEQIKLIIRSNHKYLIEILPSEISNFFARNNFGARQSKGFGSFYIDEGDKNYETPGLYSYFISNVRDKEFKKLFEDIETVHKVLRSGINDKGRGGVSLFYMKPLIWQYFKLKNIAWEKKKIKQEFYESIIGGQQADHNPEEPDKWPLYYNGHEYRMVKDLLGLSSSEKWRLPYNTEINKASDDIDRMSSPFFYKPIRSKDGYKVYIGFDAYDTEFLDSEFIISNKVKQFRIKTAAEFDIDDFFDWAFRKANVSSLIDEQYRQSPKAKRIVTIFDQLRNNI